MRWPDQQLAAMRANMARESCVHVGAAAVFFLVGWYSAPSLYLQLLLWWCAVVAVTGTGWYLVAGPRGNSLRIHIRFRLLLGILWGAFAFLIDPQWPAIAVALLNAVLVAGAVTALRVRALHPVAYAAMIAPALLIFGGALSMLGTALSAALLLIDLFVMAMLISEARYIAAIAGGRAVLQNKTREMEERLKWTTRAFQDQQLRAQREEALARQVFDRLTRQKEGGMSEISSWVCATGSFSGDLLLHADSPSGNLNILFCDFTGHGLPAAMGAIPVSGMFHAMTEKEYSPLDIAREMNQRLANLSPADYFCCACLLRISPDRRRMEVCNAGLPPLLVVGADGKVKNRYRSQLLPLGIHHTDPTSHQELVELDDQEVVYMFSDGLIESENMYGEMFGLERLEQELTRDTAGTAPIDAVRNAVVQFIGAGEPGDDISLIELRLERETASATADVA